MIKHMYAGKPFQAHIKVNGIWRAVQDDDEINILLTPKRWWVPSFIHAILSKLAVSYNFQVLYKRHLDDKS